jgi:hypothetical protein
MRKKRFKRCKNPIWLPNANVKAATEMNANGKKP